MYMYRIDRTKGDKTYLFGGGCLILLIICYNMPYLIRAVKAEKSRFDFQIPYDIASKVGHIQPKRKKSIANAKGP